MPQQQERSSTTSNPSLDSSAQSSAYSEVAVVAADASVVAVGVADAAAPIEACSTMDESLAASSRAPPSATRSTVDTAVETMWEARRKREEAEAEADRKLLDAVCKASLAEYNERERALETSSVALQQAKGEAEQRKRAAMQVVIDSKARAKQMSERARVATSLYEQKTNERLVKRCASYFLRFRRSSS